jgi:GMP synthase PP-ATPase subunit
VGESGLTTISARSAVTSSGGMTADFFPKAAAWIINEVRGVNRVVYDGYEPGRYLTD